MLHRFWIFQKPKRLDGKQATLIRFEHLHQRLKCLRIADAGKRLAGTIAEPPILALKKLNQGRDHPGIFDRDGNVFRQPSHLRVIIAQQVDDSFSKPVGIFF